jgi:hypothetical protein
MSYFRSYLEKNNTIIKKLSVNTAKNPDTQIFYGDGVSRFIFKIDLSELKEKVSTGEYTLNGNTKHILHFTNCIFGDSEFRGDYTGTGTERATAFDLILFKMDQEWDEGVGYDYEELNYDYNEKHKLYDEKPSNWYYRNSLDTWDYEGIYSGTPEIISIIHFDNGDENISEDITDYINSILSGDTDYGLGLTFPYEYEQVSTTLKQSVSFFSKYTQTFFEPYLETIFQDRINDDRETFSEIISQNLYLYVSKNGNPINLDELPIVILTDSTKTSIPGLSGLTSTHIKEGVYGISVNIEGQLCDGKRFFYDIWTNIVLEGITVNDVTQRFIPKPYTSEFNIGDYDSSHERYVMKYSGIELNERIKRGEKRKITVIFRSPFDRQNHVFDDVYYRIYIKEGKTHVNVFEWTKLDKTTENYFMLDTSYLIPREYWIEIKGKTHGETTLFKSDIKFEIISEK